MSDIIRNDAVQQRFELEREGRTALACYGLTPGIVTFMHTEVPAELAGRGVGSALIKGALDEVRRQGLEVVVECPFVSAFIAKHAEYGDLLR